jgi:hypothetical protein
MRVRITRQRASQAMVVQRKKADIFDRLIMFNLDPQIMRQFYQAEKKDGAAASSSSSSDGPTPMEEESKEEVLVNTSGQGYANLNGEGSRSGDDATKRSGIDKLLPGSDIDGFLFNPCGYCQFCRQDA